MCTHILVPVDLDQAASWEKVLPVTVRMCRAFSARLTVMTVVPGFTMAMVEQFFPPEVQGKMIEAARAGLDAFVRENIPEGVTAEVVVVKGKIYQEIIEAAHRLSADLIVIGSHAPELKDFLLGPNAARIVRHAAASVLVVR